MTCDLHAPTRRPLLLASGTVVAWAYLPKVARAEGRDPRLLVIVLRGALDGLAAVAPVGAPDWIALRGDKALTICAPGWCVRALNSNSPPRAGSWLMPTRVQPVITLANRVTSSWV